MFDEKMLPLRFLAGRLFFGHRRREKVRISFHHVRTGRPVSGQRVPQYKNYQYRAGGARPQHKVSDTVPLICPPSLQPERVQCQ